MQFVHKEGKVLNFVILILVAYVQEQDEMPYFVEYFKEHTKVTPCHFLSHILQNRKICNIDSCCIFITEVVDNPY